MEQKLSFITLPNRAKNYRHFSAKEANLKNKQQKLSIFKSKLKLFSETFYHFHVTTTVKIASVIKLVALCDRSHFQSQKRGRVYIVWFKTTDWLVLSLGLHEPGQLYNTIYYLLLLVSNHLQSISHTTKKRNKKSKR